MFRGLGKSSSQAIFITRLFWLIVGGKHTPLTSWALFSWRVGEVIIRKRFLNLAECTAISLIFFTWLWMVVRERDRILGSIRRMRPAPYSYVPSLTPLCSGITMAVTGFISLNSRPQRTAKWTRPTAMQWGTNDLEE